MAPDVVYVVKPGDTNETLRYSLRSIHQNMPHGTVWIAGYKPVWVTGVEYLPMRQDQTKYQNSTANLLTACTHPDVSDQFIYMNDDFFVVRPVRSVPNLHLGPIDGRITYYDQKYGHRPTGPGRYRDGMVQTAAMLHRWGLTNLLSYEAHVPMVIEKTLMVDALRRAFKEAKITALHKRTLYGNLYQLGGKRIEDPKMLRQGQQWRPGEQFVSTLSASWVGTAGKRIRTIFQTPSPFETDR